MVNLDNISFIEDSNGKRAVILSIELYNEIQDQLEELEDIKAYNVIKNSTNPNNLPIELVEKLLLTEESKIKLLREHKDYSLTQLSKLLDISEAYLSQIENHKRKGNIDLYKKISEILNVDIELLI